MRACVVFLYLLAATFALTVKSKPHGKHHGPHKMSHKEKDVVIEEANKAQVLPTLATFEAHSQEQEDEELSSEGNANSKTEEGRQKNDKSAAVLLSEEELVDLLKKEEAEEEEAEKRELDKERPGAVGSKLEEVPEGKGKAGAGLEKMQDGEGEAETPSDEEDQLEEVVGKLPPGVREEAGKDEKMGLMEDAEGSTDMELPVDLDYAADSGLLHPLQIISEKAKAHDADEKPPLKAGVPDLTAKEEKSDYEEGMQNTEPAGDDELPQPRHGKGNKRKGLSAKPRGRSGEKREPKDEEPRSDPQEEEEEEESRGQTRGKARKQKKNQRMRKHSPQREDVPLGPEPNQQDSQESEGGTDTTGQKAKRRRAGKWGPLVGVNPVQIRATVDLYPSSRPSTHPEAPADPCDNFRCKRGKTCKLDADNKPSCVCQAPSECPPSLNEFDHVCGTDNKTYDTSCELFATKCNLEGTKRGHRLHLDYTGSCKLIPQCVDTELVQFPLRMRDWLKNVLLQLYEHDAMAPGFLTSKQRFRVKKMYESERRLHAGDHSVELLAQDFEKNYNMYIYPVHWQFAQLDQHPSDRLLSHSELAPLRVPLVPMEHCTSRFFQECDADKDKQVSLKEWTSCFGIKDDDIDANLLF